MLSTGEAFTSVEKFRAVAEHYGGSALPADEFVRNTLQTQFGLDPRVHDEFLEFFKKNCRFVGIGANWQANGNAPGNQNGEHRRVDQPVAGGTGTVTPLSDGERPVCFVIMPFVERTDRLSRKFGRNRLNADTHAMPAPMRHFGQMPATAGLYRPGRAGTRRGYQAG